jgi:hypothetical protein
MSNSEPSVIVRQGIPCMCGLYIDSNGENGSLKLPDRALESREYQISESRSENRMKIEIVHCPT